MLLPGGSASTPPEHTTIAAAYAQLVHLRGHSLSSVACEVVFQGRDPNHASPRHQTEASSALASRPPLTHPQELHLKTEVIKFKFLKTTNNTMPHIYYNKNLFYVYTKLFQNENISPEKKYGLHLLFFTVVLINLRTI